MVGEIMVGERLRNGVEKESDDRDDDGESGEK
jgi:hypothetical protein